MKKTFLPLLFLCFLGTQSVAAFNFPGFEWSVGADVTSAYLWRGMRFGGLAFQPDVSIGYGGLTIEGWANLSPEDYTFETFAPELDVKLSYTIAGLTVGVNHLYYFDGSKYFDFKGSGYSDYLNETNSTTQTEVFAEFSLGDVLEAVPLHLGWYTYVAGDDKYIDEANPVINGTDTTFNMKRAYSSYIEVSYDINLPLNFTLTPTVGMTPWKSSYTFYEGNFAFNNLSLKLNWELEVSEHFTLDVYAIGMLNTYGINKENLVPEIRNSYCNQRLNGAIGVGLWLY
ncbi:MAG TPA: hypothetical protein DIW30_01575 [Bacteroidales bacterium]|nr:hypothetical protein [Bacteroidales bacterium]